MANVEFLQQVHVVFSLIAPLLFVHLLVVTMQASIAGLLADPPIVLHDSVSLTISPGEANISSHTTFGSTTDRKRPRKLSSLIFRYGPYSELVQFDSSLVDVEIVPSEHVPYPCMARRALRLSRRHTENGMPDRIDEKIRNIHV